jgi:hypothetical protein
MTVKTFCTIRHFTLCCGRVLIMFLIIESLADYEGTNHQKQTSAESVDG